jgi:hypothetical protein
VTVKGGADGFTPPQTIIIESPNPEWSCPYSPTVVYGAWAYPMYPPYPYYPRDTHTARRSGHYRRRSRRWRHLGQFNWGGNDVDIDINRQNNFNRNEINTGDRNRNNVNSNNRGNNSGNKQAGTTTPRIARVGYKDSATQQVQPRRQSAECRGARQYRGHAEQGYSR